MSYRSRRFSKLREKDELLLYFMSVVALVQIFYLVMNKKYTFILLFFALGIVLNIFIKKQAHVLIIDIILVNILLHTTKREGLTTKEPVKAKLPVANTDTDSKNKAQPKKAKSVSTETSVDAPTTLKPKESFADSNSAISSNIEAMNVLLDKFHDISKMVGLKKNNS